MSLNLVDAKELLTQEFVTAWGATTPIDLDNEKIDPPNDAAWVRVAIRHNASNQETLGGVGNRFFTRGGSAFIQVFGRLNKGSREADTLAQQARAVFEGKTIANEIRILDVIVREIGPDEAWYQVNVEAQFEYTEIK